jgi:hypothetical protein
MAKEEASDKEREFEFHGNSAHVEAKAISGPDDLTDIPDAAAVIDKKAERALKLKTDFLILPIMSLTYLVAYLVSQGHLLPGCCCR